MKTIEEYYEMNQEEIKIYLKGIKEEVAGDPRFTELTKIVERDVTNYEADYYVHDILNFKEMKSSKYIWIVRELGTQLVPLENEFSEYVETDKQCWEAYKNAYKKRGKVYLVTAGNTLSVKLIQFDDVKDDWFKTKNGQLTEYLAEQGFDIRKIAEDVHNFKIRQNTKEEIEQHFLKKEYGETTLQQGELSF